MRRVTRRTLIDLNLVFIDMSHKQFEYVANPIYFFFFSEKRFSVGQEVNSKDNAPNFHTSEYEIQHLKLQLRVLGRNRTWIYDYDAIQIPSTLCCCTNDDYQPTGLSH